MLTKRNGFSGPFDTYQIAGIIIYFLNNVLPLVVYGPMLADSYKVTLVQKTSLRHLDRALLLILRSLPHDIHLGSCVYEI
jgi:hypothetical protein